ncbi:MAG: lysylphosphatidylglycerol synthase transmembrane domain-containing protein [Vicinamibacterales bacterium]
MMWKRPAFWLTLQVGVTLALLVLLFETFDWRAFGVLFARLPVSAYLASLLVVLAGQLLYAWRWRMVLRAGNVPVRFREVFSQYLIGMFVGNFLPSTVGGDVAKVYLLGRNHGYGPITASVVLDRMFGFGLAAMLAACALVMAAPTAPVLRLVRTVLVLVAAATVLGSGVALAGTGGLARRVARFGPRVTGWADALQRFRLSVLTAVRSPRVLLHAVGTVVVYFVLLSLVYRLLIVIMCGRQLGLLETLMVVTSVSVMSNLPISLNGLGVREQLHVVLFEPLGVPKEVSVAVSLLLFSHTLLISVVGGALWMRSSRARTPLSPPRDTEAQPP